jgi:hypothetical protein
MAADMASSAVAFVHRALAGDRVALARALSWIESESPESQTVLDLSFTRTGRACRIGITGPPGAGKSTLVARIAKEYRLRKQTVAVVAVDPTSPFTGGAVLGDVPAIEMVTVGQRRGIGLPGGGPKRYVTAIDRASDTIVVGDEADLYDTELRVGNLVWADQLHTGDVMVQCSAHGVAMPARLHDRTVQWHQPQRCVAPGQSVVFYDASNRYVLGGGIAT